MESLQNPRWLLQGVAMPIGHWLNATNSSDKWKRKFQLMADLLDLPSGSSKVSMKKSRADSLFFQAGVLQEGSAQEVLRLMV